MTNAPVVGNGGTQDIENIRSELERWHGRAATEFRTNFLDGLDDKSGAQWTLAWVLLQSLRAERSIWERAQKDVDQVAHDTIDVLKGDSEMSATDKSGTEVFNAILAVGAAIPGVNTGIGVFTAAVSVLELLGSQGTGEARPRSPEDVAGIVATMHESLNTVNQAIREREEDLQTSLSEVLSGVQGSAALYVLPRPGLANPGNSQEQFGENF